MNEFIEAVKEALRVTVLAIIPIVILGLQNNAVDWNLVYLTGAISLLRFADSWLHEVGKSKKNALMTKGLTGF